MRYPHIRIHYIEVLCATDACGGVGRGLREILWLRVSEIERRYSAGKAAGRFITPSRAKPARVGDPGCGPRDDNGEEPTLWKARVGAPAKALKSPGPLTKAVSGPWATKGRKAKSKKQKAKSKKQKAKSRPLGPPTPSRAKPARVGDPGYGPRDDNGGEPTLWKARVGAPAKALKSPGRSQRR